jgi:hypothetical protein
VWTRCSLSPHLDTGTGVESDAAREGTCAAWVADTVLRGDASCAEDMAGKTHPNGWFVDADMVTHVQEYIDLVSPCDSEVQVRLSEQIYGTMDSVATFEKSGTLRVVDLKYGYKIVEPFENAQLLCYAAAIPSDTPLIQLCIYQPRAIHPDGVFRKWTISRADLNSWRAWILDRADDVMARPMGHPGRHCLYCEGASSCTALTNTVYSMWDVVEDARQTQVPDDRAGAELTVLRKMSAILKARQDAVEADITARIGTGRFIPGWGMIVQHGKRAWKADAATVEVLTGIRPTVEKMVTPSELERRGVAKETVNALSYRPQSKGCSLMAEYTHFHTPVGRFVSGSLTEKRTKNMTGEELPPEKHSLQFGVAIRKDDPGFPALWQTLCTVAMEGYRNNPGVLARIQQGLAGSFAFKVSDGDVPGAKTGTVNKLFAGHYILWFSTTQSILGADRNNQSIPLDHIKRGYFVDVSASTTPNGMTDHTAGIYLNPVAVRLVAFGDEIVSGPTLESALAKAPALPATLPPGASLTPSAPTGLPAPGLPAPGLPAAAPVAGAPVAGAPMPGLPAAGAAQYPAILGGDYIPV